MKKVGLPCCYKLIVFIVFFAGSFLAWTGISVLPLGFCSKGAAGASIPEDSIEIKTAFEKIKSGNYSEAQKSFQKILESDPKNHSALTGLSTALLCLKDYQGAMAIDKRMIAMDPMDPVPYMNMGDMFRDQENWKEARMWYEKANNLGLEHPHLLNSLGAACSMSGDPKSAVAFLEKSLKMEKDSNTYRNLGMTYLMLENYLAAEEAFLEALKMDPSDLYSLSRLGYVQVMAGSPQEGVNTLKAVLKQSPQHEYARKNLGIYYLTTKDYDAALFHLKEALKTNPNDADIYSGLGVAYWGKNDKANAKIMVEKALSLDPDNKEYKHQLESLTRLRS